MRVRFHFRCRFHAMPCAAFSLICTRAHERYAHAMHERISIISCAAAQLMMLRAAILHER